MLHFTVIMLCCIPAFDVCPHFACFAAVYLCKYLTKELPIDKFVYFIDTDTYYSKLF